MKSNLPIDHLFRSSLQGFEEPAPMHVFDRILEQRGHRKNKKVAPWILFLAFAVVSSVLALGLYGFMQQPKVRLDSFPVPIKLAEALENPGPVDIRTFDPLSITPA